MPLFNLGDFQPDSDSYADLTRQTIESMMTARVDEQITALLQDVFGKTLEEQKVVLSRTERERLLHKVTKTILTDMLVGLDPPK
jgi:hypothetical protein